MSDAKRDNNRVPAILGTSNVDDATPVPIGADPVTKRMLVQDDFMGFYIPENDSFEVTYPLVTQEVYVFKNGGATVATVTLNYTDNTKNFLLNGNIVRV